MQTDHVIQNFKWGKKNTQYGNVTGLFSSVFKQENRLKNIRILNKSTPI
jgi:hypothetical protein